MRWEPRVGHRGAYTPQTVAIQAQRGCTRGHGGGPSRERLICVMQVGHRSAYTPQTAAIQAHEAARRAMAAGPSCNGLICVMHLFLLQAEVLIVAHGYDVGTAQHAGWGSGEHRRIVRCRARCSQHCWVGGGLTFWAPSCRGGRVLCAVVCLRWAAPVRLSAWGTNVSNM